MQPSIPRSSSVSLFVIEMMAIIYSLKCTVPFHSLYHCSHSLSLFAICRRSLPLIVTLCHLLYHSLSLVVIHCDSLSFVVTRYTNCSHSLYHSLPLVVIHCDSLLLVVTRCTTRLSFYKRCQENSVYKEPCVLNTVLKKKLKGEIKLNFEHLY